MKIGLTCFNQLCKDTLLPAEECHEIIRCKTVLEVQYSCGFQGEQLINQLKMCGMFPSSMSFQPLMLWIRRTEPWCSHRQFTQSFMKHKLCWYQHRLNIGYYILFIYIILFNLWYQWVKNNNHKINYWLIQKRKIL